MDGPAPNATVPDVVFQAEGTRIIDTPIRAPNANAHAKRWVGSVRSECLDWTLVRGRRHLEAVLRTYVGHYKCHRPHRALGSVLLLVPRGDRMLPQTATSASCGARSSAGSSTSTASPREDQVSGPRNRPERLTVLTRRVMVSRDQELPGSGSGAALRPSAGSPVRSSGAEGGFAKAPDAGCCDEAGRSSRAAGKPSGTAAR